MDGISPSTVIFISTPVHKTSPNFNPSLNRNSLNRNSLHLNSLHLNSLLLHQPLKKGVSTSNSILVVPISSELSGFPLLWTGSLHALLSSNALGCCPFGPYCHLGRGISSLPSRMQECLTNLGLLFVMTIPKRC